MFFTFLNLISFITVMSVLWCFRSCSRWFSVPASVFMFFGLLKIPVFVYYGGNLFSPQLPRHAVIFFSWCSGFLWISFALTLLLCALHLIPVVKSSGEKIRSFCFPLIFVLAALSAVLTGLNALRPPELVKANVFRSDEHVFNRPMKIIQLSDLHLSSLTDGTWFADMITTVNSQEPDLVILSGDVADGTVSRRSPFVDRLKEIKASKGIVVVPGNHEYYIDYHGWMNLYRGMNFTVLENGVWSFRYEDVIVDIIGLTDEEARRYDLPEPRAAVMNRSDPSEGRIRILVKHRPKNLDTMIAPGHGIRLALSGHTHGGMIPILSPLVAFMNSGFCQGKYRIGDTILFVSDGTFLWNGFPFRLNSRNMIAEFIFEG